MMDAQIRAVMSLDHRVMRQEGIVRQVFEKRIRGTQYFHNDNSVFFHLKDGE